MRILNNLISRFIKQLLIIINTQYQCYYEEAPSSTSFPFLVVPFVSLSPLHNGYLALFDIYIYNNETSDISIENISESLIGCLNNYSYCDEYIGFHVGFEDGMLQKSTEQDLTIRKISFSARIFRKE